MKYLLAILLTVSPVLAQTGIGEATSEEQNDSLLAVMRENVKRWRIEKRDAEIRTERTIYAIANYGLGVVFATLDASQDAITYSPNKTTQWGLNHGDYHAIKMWRNTAIVGCGISLGGRVLSDISYQEGTWGTLKRLGLRLLGVGMLNYVAWDMAYNSNRYGTPFTLEPSRYQHWSGIDWLDRSMKPTTRVDVVYIYILKLGLAAGIILLGDEL